MKFNSYFLQNCLNPPEIDCRGRKRKRFTLKDDACPTIFSYKPAKKSRRALTKRIVAKLDQPTEHASSVTADVDHNEQPMESTSLVADPRVIKVDHCYTQQPFRYQGPIISEEPCLLASTNVDQIDQFVEQDLNKSLQKEVEELRAQVASLKSQLDGCNRIFNSDQMEYIGGKNIQQWSVATLQNALYLRFKLEATGYETLRSLGLPYPSIRTLNRHLSNLRCNPGILDDVFAMLEKKAEKMTPQDLVCSLVDDEMSIKKAIEYDPSIQQLIGYITIPLNPDRKKGKSI